MKFENFGSGFVVTDRRAVKCTGTVSLQFEDAQGLVAILRGENGEIAYRHIVGGVCSFPVDLMSGRVSISLAMPDDTKPTYTKCEGILITDLGGGSVILSPDDIDLGEKYIMLLSENHEIRKRLSQLEKQLAALSARFDKMLEGYDIT